MAHSATMPARTESNAAKMPVPREHGAWGLLLQPFAAGVLLAEEWNWLLWPALALVLLGFVMREPLVVLARQQFVWRSRNPQSQTAARWLAAELALTAICIAALAAHLPLGWLAGLVGTAGTLTVLAVWMTIKNRQRSLWLQILSAAGLATTALLALLVTGQTVPVWGWLLWAVLTCHGAASILVVHTRLDLKIGLRQGHTAVLPPGAFVPAGLQLLAAVGSASLGSPAAIPFAFSGLVAAVELWRLRTAQNLQEPLMHVGLRALGVSIAHSLCTVAALWPLAHTSR